MRFQCEEEYLIACWLMIGFMIFMIMFWLVFFIIELRVRRQRCKFCKHLKDNYFCHISKNHFHNLHFTEEQIKKFGCRFFKRK